MLFLRQSTASQEVMIGPFLSDTDGKTAQTGLTIANTDIKLWVAGATSEASKNSGGATHIAAGRYYCVLDATDTATVGSGEINVSVAGALPVRRPFTILTALVYDSLIAGSDNLQIDAVQISGQTASAAGTVTFPGTIASSTNITAGTITTVTTVTNQLTAAQIATGVWQDATAGDFTTASSIGKSLYTSGVVPGGSGGLFIAGTNAATTITTALTTTFTGSLTGSVASVTARVTANTDQLAGQTVTAATGVTFPTSVANQTTVAALPTAAGIATAVANEFSVAADSVQASPSPTTTTFAGSASLSSTDDFYNGSVFVPSSGTLDGVARKIVDYTGTTRLITVSPALPAAPASGVTFRILGRID